MTPAAAAPMGAVERIEAVAGRGLHGDRYHADAGHWQSIEACQLTLITAHELARARRRAARALRAALDAGAHRRNLVVGGLKPRDLEGRTFRIGGAMLQYHKPRPPCGHLDRVAGRGLARALGPDSGLCLRVLDGGVMQVGDAVEFVDP